MTALTHCDAGERCLGGTNLYDDDGEKVGRVGAVIHTGILCDPCRASIGYAVAAIPGDVRDLIRLLPPSLQQKLKDPDLPSPPRIKLHSPMPLRGDVLALIELIDYETVTWAGSVAQTARLDGSATEGDGRTGFWRPLDVARSRQEVRIRRACDLLADYLGTLIALGPTEHRARSVTTRRADGHDPDITTRSGDDYWTTRTGVQGGMLLRKLHRDAEKFTGRAPGERTTVPCPGCHRRLQRRDVTAGWVVCDGCGRCVTDDEHEDLIDVALAVHGLPPVEYSERDPSPPTRRRPEPPPAPPWTLKRWHNGWTPVEAEADPAETQ